MTSIEPSMWLEQESPLYPAYEQVYEFRWVISPLKLFYFLGQTLQVRVGLEMNVASVY